jgi:L-alanine-DL-glutamate epimerase-like enolase superfamily enzyme
LWGIFKKSYEPRNGYMQVPDVPGLGLELAEAAMKRLVAE